MPASFSSLTRPTKGDLVVANGKKNTTPKLVEAVASSPEETAAVTPITKPSGFSLEKFRSKRADALANIGTEITGLKHCRISEAKDFVRLHLNEETHWSFELCFVSVPIKGEKNDTLHLIDEDLAMLYVPSGKIQRFRLALASKPFDVFFLCQVPTQNIDNDWNKSNLEACEKAKTLWRTRSSMRATRTPFPSRNGRRSRSKS
jgi:hypothetical protein